MKFKDGFYADVRREIRFASNVQYVGNDLTECKDTVIDKAFIRVYDGKMWYYCSTDNPENVQAELDTLYECAMPNPDILNDPVVKKFEVNRDKLLKYENNSVADIPLEKKRDFIEKRKKFVEDDEYLKVASAVYGDRRSVYEFCSSLGADITYDIQYVTAIIQVSLAFGKETFDNHIIKSADCFNDLKITKAELTDFMYESDKFLLTARSVEPGNYPVVLAPPVAGVFAHESFGHKSEADFMLGDETMKKEWALGKKVATDVLSIYDTGDIAGAGYVPYDDEGTKTKKTYLIKDGILTGRLHSAKTAADIGEELTGNARAINCDFEPIVRMTTTLIEGKGDNSFKDLVKQIRYGYFIKTCKHGSGLSRFTIAPNIAYRIENGKITCPVKIAVISGDVFETLGKIDGVSKAEDMQIIGGNCGKMEQYPLKVSLGGAYISVSEMNVQ